MIPVSDHSSLPALESLFVWRDQAPHSATLNMAIDEALLMQDLPASLLRIYTWEKPAISMGYFQKASEIRSQVPNGVELVRRSTGGGLVDHRDDATYSLVIPSSNALARATPEEAYRVFHAGMCEAFQDAGIAAELAPECNPAGAGACFAGGYARFDVLIAGRKVAGAAQRRSRYGLLHQGSIQYQALSPDFWDRFAHKLSGDLRAFLPEEDLWRTAQELEVTKYANPGWLNRR